MIDHETSQVIVNLSANTVYENTLRVKGREEGNYSCNVSNNFGDDSQVYSAFVVRGDWIINRMTIGNFLLSMYIAVMVHVVRQYFGMAVKGVLSQCA